MKLLMGSITPAELEGAERITLNMALYAQNAEEMKKLRVAASRAFETFLRQKYNADLSQEIQLKAVELLMVGDLFIRFGLRELFDQRVTERMWALMMCLRNNLLITTDVQPGENGDEAATDIKH